MSATFEIPDVFFTEESGDSAGLLADLKEIRGFYEIYRDGAKWKAIDESKDFTPSDLKFKISASLINKQARFLFAEAPDIVIEPNDELGELSENDKTAIFRLNSLVRSILYENKFEEVLLKAVKDCFIGKRVAGVVNFDEQNGVTLTFIPATQFVYETSFYSAHVVTKFVYFRAFYDGQEKRIYKKKYTLESDEIVYIEEGIYNDSGELVEVTVERMSTILSAIPVSVFINDGLTGDKDGESEIGSLEMFESWYSRMSNADIDAGRQNMNPVTYALDLDPSSMANLRRRPGEFWDLATNQNQELKAPGKVGTLENAMSYSEPLKTTLDRIKTSAYEQVDMPNISLESMAGVVTSGKSLKAIYWSLIIRCKEKMNVWGPQLRQLIIAMINGSYLYPTCIEKYISEPLIEVDYEVRVVQNHSLPEDEIEEMKIDIANVDAKTMSKKAYMQKWRGLTDAQVEEELKQMALERQIMEDSYAPLDADLSMFNETGEK